MILFLYSYPWNCSWAQITISNHTLLYFISRPQSLIIFQLSEIHIISSFCSQASKAQLTTKIGPLAYEILNSKFECFTTLHLSYLGVTTKTRTSFSESGQFYERPRASLPGTNKAKLASLTHANHWRREMALKDPKAWLAAELVLRCHRLQEQFPGAPALAMSRKRSQSGRWLWPHQLLDGS